MIKQLSNSVIAKYCDLSMSRRSIICLSLRLRQIIDLLATDKSQYFAQPRQIIVNYSTREELIQFITAVNSFHPALKYTWEINFDTPLAFLDISFYQRQRFMHQCALHTNKFS